MIRRVTAHIRKELLLLLRDRAGLALLFGMPVALVCIMAVVQDAPFKDFTENRVKVLLLDHDGGGVGRGIREGLEQAGPFIVTDGTGSGLSDADLRDRVRRGEQQVGVIVPAGLSDLLADRSTHQVASYFDLTTGEGAGPDTANVVLVIDPTVKQAFRSLVAGALERVLAGLSAQRLLTDLARRMSEMTGDSVDAPRIQGSFIGVEQRLAAKDLAGEKVALDSTQHNVPAWTIFAMFFSVVLLAGNMVKERDSGCMTRLLTMPGTTTDRILGRLAAYLFVCMAQTLLLLLVGRFALPWIGLAPLRLSGPAMVLLLFVAAAVVGLAATSFGILIGSFTRTQQQSAVLGSTAVVILSAIGGIWVPLYIMPDAMQALGRLSPLNWSMEAFNAVLLRGGAWTDLLPYLLPLLVFTCGCIALSVFGERRVARR
ncbi:MAG: ABC transporter permease [Flavobacteriales bacterium]|nr:ABC transporter permease [Flavobacteriales bacterium]MCB9168454.1 ABC transporter permease [Flavobacteriales bacterium]